MKKIGKCLQKTTAFLIVFIITFSASSVIFCNTAYAVQSNDTYITYNKELYESNKELCDRLADGMKNFEEQIYIGDFKITSTEKMKYLMKTVLRKHPELFFVDTTQYILGLDEKYIAVICPIYLYDRQTSQSKLDDFNEKCRQYTEKVNDSMSDFEKAVVLHDELVLNCKYFDENGSGLISAYEALVNGNANCQGYAEAYSYLLSLVGVYTEIVESSSMYHIWSKVKIGNDYYNVDLTWDDPMPDKAGHVSHKYFLLSDTAISSGDDDISKHYGFDYAYFKSNNTKYDKCLFREFDTKFCFIGNDCYVIDNKYQSRYEKCLLKYNTQKDTAEIVKQFDYVWRSGTTSRWKGGYMSLDENDGLLYFNSSDSIYSYDVNDNNLQLFSNVDTSLGDCYGMKISDATVYSAVGENPNVEYIILKTGKCILRNESIRFVRILGDVNGDETVNIEDATKIQKYFVSLEDFTEEQIQTADFNEDGTVNISDVTEIQKYIAGI